jgi:hypothetical protein
MAQAIPLVTRADPTATQRALSEGYLTQPMVMAHAAWNPFAAIATLNLEGLTLARGELNTGGFGEGYVDRRHPHAYVHELLIGAQGAGLGARGSLFVGRGFVPFGSDDPMVRPFVKYPVNHHLAQVLERVIAVAAVRRGPVIAELATFNGDEPASPGEAPAFRRFGDSWSSRITLLPLAGAEVSGSIARVTSPEERTGAGLDQHKASVVGQFSRAAGASWHYALAEWAHTSEVDGGRLITSLTTVLGEAAICRAGVIVAGRLERTDRPEEEPLADPFRVPRPAGDLSNLGVSRWTTVSLAVSPSAARAGAFSGRPFIELARVSVGPGNPPGVFNPEFRYGANRMWMLSAGVRLRAGAMHPRMGRYGAAIPDVGSGTHSHQIESESMPGMTMSPHSDSGMPCSL